MERKSFLTKPWVILTLATLCTFLWGSAFPAVKKGYEIFNIQGNDLAGKLLFAGIRFTFAGIIVLAAGSFIGKKIIIPKKKDLLPVMSLGIVQTTLQYIFFYIGLSNATGTKSSVTVSYTHLVQDRWEAKRQGRQSLRSRCWDTTLVVLDF